MVEHVSMTVSAFKPKPSRRHEGMCLKETDKPCSAQDMHSNATVKVRSPWVGSGMGYRVECWRVLAHTLSVVTRDAFEWRNNTSQFFWTFLRRLRPSSGVGGTTANADRVPILHRHDVIVHVAAVYDVPILPQSTSSSGRVIAAPLGWVWKYTFLTSFLRCALGPQWSVK